MRVSVEKIESLVRKFREVFRVQTNPKVSEEIGAEASDSIFNETVHKAKLSGESYDYNKKYLAWKKRRIGAPTLTATNKIRNKATKKKREDDEGKKPLRVRKFFTIKRAERRPMGVKVTDHVNMYLTGDLMGSLQFREARSDGDTFEIEIGFDDANSNDVKIEKANSLGRYVLGLTEKQADKIAKMYVKEKFEEIWRNFPADVTIFIGKGQY